MRERGNILQPSETINLVVAQIQGLQILQVVEGLAIGQLVVREVERGDQ